MKTYTREDIIEDYTNLQRLTPDKQVTRSQYRKDGEYSTSLIERLFGSWTKFVKEVNFKQTFEREEIIKTCESTKVIITSILDGTEINEEAFEVLKSVAKWNHADLYVLWSKSPSKKQHGLSLNTYNKLKDYLATEILFENDIAIAKDLNIPYLCKKPLTNIDKISKNYDLFVVAHPKQYHEMACNDNNSEPRQLWSTGTISEIDFPKTVAGLLDKQNSTFGGLFLQYSLYSNKYNVRNLEYIDGYIYDLDCRYSKGMIELMSGVPAIVCGDIHFPEHDEQALEDTVAMIERCQPRMVFLHDLFSLNSINHHELNNPLTRVVRQTEDSITLEHELEIGIKLLKYYFLDRFPDITFYVVASNHDNFIMKWLNSGKYLTDTPNIVIGHEMFAKVAKGNHPFADMISNTNIEFLTEKSSIQPVKGIECGNHGHIGIAGSRGNTNAYNKTYSKSVIGHSHSSKILEHTVTVGTNSLLELKYTGPIMNWSHANAIIFSNTAIQLVLLD